MTEYLSWGCRTVTAEVRVPKVNETAIGCTGVVGGRALIVTMLSTEAPAACLPKGTFFDSVARSVIIAFETVGELDLSSSMPLAQYGAAFETVFSFFDIGWPLSGEDAWDPIITGWDKEGGGGRGACGEKVLLKTSANCTRGQAPFYYE